MTDLLGLLYAQTTNEYKVNTTKTDSYEVFFVHDKVETVRSTSTTTTKVTIYSHNDDKKGENTFSVYPSDTDEIIIQKIKDAEQKASIITNEDYELPKDETLEKTIPSSFEKYEMKDLAEKIANAVFKANTIDGGSINAVEIFIYHDDVSVVNSYGVEKKQSKYRAMVEAIPTWNEEGESVELYEQYHFTEFDEDEITNEISKKMMEVRDRYHASKISDTNGLDVVLNIEEASGLFSEIASNLNCSAVYSNSTPYSKGMNIQNVLQGDPITITMRGEIKGCRYSSSFDSDGVTLVDKTIVEDGRAVAYYGGNRFSQYLKQEPTGNLPCIEVNEGSVSDEELENSNYFECVSLSGIQIDILNDYLGGEVRLAYLHKGGEKIPVTGISITGKLSEILPDMKMTKTRKTNGAGYYGPEKLILKHVAII